MPSAIFPTGPTCESRTFQLWKSVLGFLLLVHATSFAYIPAIPTNDSLSLPTNSDPSWFIQLNWHPMGIFSDGVSRQLKADNASSNLHQGVLLHFSEFNATSQPPANVPWIAMISCDTNTSSYSMVDDIFTLARDRGAAAAMLFSLTARSCSVNAEYVSNFEKPLDVYSSGNLQGARLIESQFSNVVGSGYWFQSNLLNSSASTILMQINQTGYMAEADGNSISSSSSLSAAVPESTLPPTPSLFGDSTLNSTRVRRSAAPVELAVTRPNNLAPSKISPVSSNSTPVYLIATLANSNTASTQQRSNGNTTPNTANNNNGSSPNTGLAMIILYAITGCVTLIARLFLFTTTVAVLFVSPHNFLARFLIVIISGAIRAVRHPERYGPRPGGLTRHPGSGDDGEEHILGRQTRAGGLTKAILDTFPIVKFGRSPLNMPETRSYQTTKRQLKASPDEESIMMRDCGRPGSWGCSPISMPPDPKLKGDIRLSPGASSNNANLINKHSDRPVDPGAGNLGSSSPDPEHSDMSPTLSATIQIRDAVSEGCASKSEDVLTSSTITSTASHVDAKITPKSPSADNAADDTADDDVDVAPMLGDVNNSVTCPICVCDFDADDDIRVLPCDARHRFHQECVDPWLLNVSRFCPLCRWDLSTRKDGTKIAEEPARSSSSAAVNSFATSQVAPDLPQPVPHPSSIPSSTSTSERPTEAQIVANLHAMLQNSRQQHRSSRNERETESRLKKYVNQVRRTTGLRRTHGPPAAADVETSTHA